MLSHLSESWPFKCASDAVKIAYAILLAKDVHSLCKMFPTMSRCALANLTRCISELCYKFPVEAPFLVFFHIDGYQFGVHKNFEGSDSYFIAADGMTSFACMKTVTDASATIYASTSMKDNYDALWHLPYACS